MNSAIVPAPAWFSLGALMMGIILTGLLLLNGQTLPNAPRTCDAGYSMVLTHYDTGSGVRTYQCKLLPANAP